MTDQDKASDTALAGDKRDLRTEAGEEPPLVDQAFGVFAGRTGWMNLLLVVVQTLLFILGVLAAWKFFRAGDPVVQLRWGLPAAVLLLMSLIVKSMLWPAFHASRILRELRLIQLQLARFAPRADAEASKGD